MKLMTKPHLSSKLDLRYLVMQIYIGSFLMILGILRNDGYKIGGLFYSANETMSMQEVAFRSAVASSVASAEIDEKFINSNPTLELYIRNDTPMYNSYLTQHIVCEMLSEGVIAVFGPQFGDSSPIVQAICDAKEIPHIQMRYDSKQYIGSCLVNLYPHPTSLSKVYGDIIKKWGWKSLYIVYEDNESLIRVSDLLKPETTNSAAVKLIQLRVGDYRKTFKKIQSSGEKNILIDCKIDVLDTVLNQAQQVGLIIQGYNYIITCLDLHTLNLEQYMYSGANITGFRLIDTEGQMIMDVVNQWNLLYHYNVSTNQVLVDAALMYDAVKLFIHAVQYHADALQTTLTGCDSSESSMYGFSLINQMKLTELEGLTGLIKFNHEGFRTSIELEIVELTEKGIIQKGIWNSTTGVEITHIDDTTDEFSEPIKDLRNATLNILVSLVSPYAMMKKSSGLLQGNDRYEGFCIDLITELSRAIGFNYIFILQEDKKNGNIVYTYNNGTKKWDGMMGAIIEGVADMAVGDLTINSDREKDVDFTSPFMNLGIGIIYKKPSKGAPQLFSFLSPFGVDVWFLVITAYIGVSLLFFIMARISPYEWVNPYPCIEEPESLENQFTLRNSFWFTIGALMQQGSDIAPISTSTRMAAGTWWFFTLIMVSSYTANLAAFLTFENPVSPFSSAEELAQQTVIKYGAKKDGTTHAFFRDSTKKEFKMMGNYMEAHPECMVTDNELGVLNVKNAKNDDYAFLMETTTIQYYTERHCDLASIGPPLDNKDYGIAMRKGTAYLNTINENILLLQEQGVLSTLKRKWWKEKYSGNCAVEKASEAENLGLGNVGGVFLVLTSGVIIGFFVLALELYVFLKNAAKEEHVPFKERLVRELKFILQCQSVRSANYADGSLSDNNDIDQLQETEEYHIIPKLKKRSN